MKLICKLFIILPLLLQLSANAQSGVGNIYQQKKIDVKITIDTAIDILGLYVQIDDGTKLHLLRDSLAKRSFRFTSPYFASYASLSISTSQGQDFEYFLDDRTTDINILSEIGSTNVVNVLYSPNVTDLMDSTQNPLRKVFSEFRKNDSDNLAVFDLWTSRAKELKSNDSLRNVYSTLLKSFHTRLFHLYAQYPSDYYTFYCFRMDVDFLINQLKDDKDYFSKILDFYHSTFPEEFRNTLEGKKLETGIISKITSAKDGDLLDIVFIDIDGVEHRSKDFKSEYILLDFWATWCPPCMAQIPHIRALQERFSNGTLQVIGISADQDSSKMKDAIGKHQMKWTHIWDENRLLEAQLNVLAYPTLILIDRSGKIVYRRAGTGDDEKLLRILEKK